MKSEQNSKTEILPVSRQGQCLGTHSRETMDSSHCPALRCFHSKLSKSIHKDGPHGEIELSWCWSITRTNVWSAAQHPSPASGFEDKGNGSLFIKNMQLVVVPSSLGNDLPALDSYISSHIHVSLVCLFFGLFFFCIFLKWQSNVLGNPPKWDFNLGDLFTFISSWIA